MCEQCCVLMNQVPTIIVRFHCRLRLHNSSLFYFTTQTQTLNWNIFILNKVNPKNNNVTHTHENTHTHIQKKLTKAFKHIHDLLLLWHWMFNLKKKQKHPPTTTRISPQMQILFNVISKKINWTQNQSLNLNFDNTYWPNYPTQDENYILVPKRIILPSIIRVTMQTLLHNLLSRY